MRALAAVVLLVAATQVAAAAPERVTFKSGDGTPLAGYLLKPRGSGPFPALVLLHGCGGLFSRTGELAKRETDWAQRFVAAGYAVMFPDSFNPRGFASVCTERKRGINPTGRARDTAGAVRWLKAQPFIASGRIAVIGWSNGGSTVLNYVAGTAAGDVAGAIAFYPGCSTLLKRGDWASRVPLTILIGADDDWTPAAPCRQLVAAAGEKVRIETYPGAYHGFDSPDSKVRTRKGVAFSASGTGIVHVGTNRPARQAAIGTTMKFLSERLGP
jgi:dienelactone hydrolase